MSAVPWCGLFMEAATDPDYVAPKPNVTGTCEECGRELWDGEHPGSGIEYACEMGDCCSQCCYREDES